jgi:transposase
MALFQDLGIRIVDLVASGASLRAAARQFKVGTGSAIRFIKQAEEKGHVDVINYASARASLIRIKQK